MGNDGPTELQRRILDTPQRFPNASKEELATRCECSVSTVRRTLDDYGDPSKGNNLFGF